ncbi:MAG: hypothetical protein ACREBC_02145 [Pyrinomonadaceae bacterium]
MKARKALLIMTFMVLLLAFPTGPKANSSATNTTDLSEECKAEIKAVLQSCAQACPRDLRCFIRCIIDNYPECLK